MGRKEASGSMTNLLLVSVGDVVTLRKPHPCGGLSWRVTRVGADVGLECATCGRRVMLDREEFERRTRRIEPSVSADPAASGEGAR